MQVNVVLTAAPPRVHPRLIVPAVFVYTPLAGVVVGAENDAGVPPLSPQLVTEVDPPPAAPVGVTLMVDVVAPAGPAGKFNVPGVPTVPATGLYAKVGPVTTPLPVKLVVKLAAAELVVVHVTEPVLAPAVVGL